MMAFRWSRVALRRPLGGSVPAARVWPSSLPGRVPARTFHLSPGAWKDPRDPKDPRNPRDPSDAKDESAAGEGAVDSSDSVQAKDSKDPKSKTKTSKEGPKGPDATVRGGASSDKDNDAKQDETKSTSDTGKDAANDSADGTKDAAIRDSVSARDGKPGTEQPVSAKEEDSRAAWDPPTTESSIERKRRLLLNSQRRRSRRGDMFNPKDLDEGGESPPITAHERLLPIQLPFRPVYPGASTYLVSGDTRLMNALKKLQETDGWDHRVFAVMSKAPVKSAQLVTNVDDVHEIGCVCILDNLTINKTPETDRYSALAALFPMYRARSGELVENVRAAVESPEPQTPPSEADAALDHVRVQYMKGLSAVPNEPYAVADGEIQRQCVRIIDALHEIASSSSSTKRLIEEFSALVPQSPGGVTPQPDFLADFTASILPRNDTLQKVLEETNVLNRLKMVAELASKEVTYLRVQEGIYRYGQNQTEQRNREMILHEYLRYIKKELGLDGDDKSRTADKFLDRAAKVEMPEEVRKVFDEELNKFRSLEPTSGEYNTVRSYLDWLSALPWGHTTPDRFDLSEARRVLDKTHYGMEDVKDRILEFLAVGKLNGSVDGKIVCLSGPPGVGKTSIAKSVAEALGRKFDRFSVGGLHDASEIKGHRRTYVAAMPGRIVQALKRTQTLNPVILIDEIDKLGHGGAHGSPSAALLEVLDPEQNKAFQDTYLEVPVDLSRVLFLCTANYLENIPAPLMDRMEIINVPGYLPEEKVEIASSHLAPKSQREAGLGAASVTIDKDALNYLVRKYTREAGVRGLSKSIEKIFRKVAINLVSEQDNKSQKSQSSDAPAATQSKESVGSVTATEGPDNKSEAEPLFDSVGSYELNIAMDDLPRYVGPPVHNSDRMYDVLPTGVSMGLGWTPTGGMPLFIESVLQEPLTAKTKARLTRTGSLGEVMNESTSIAYSFARMYMTRHFPRNRFLDHAVIHTHFPEGAIKKDGPSAGITMATSLLSLSMDVPVHNDVAMTGELSLTGKVLQIGGLREKAVAAKTAGSKIIIFPEDNRAEWEDLPESVRRGLEAHPVKHYQQVFDIAFGNVDAAKVNAAWPELKQKEDEKDAGVRSQVAA